MRERRVAAVLPAVAGRAVEENMGGDAASREPARQFIALLVDHDIAIAAAGREDHGGPIGVGWTEDVEPWPDDMFEHPVAGLRVVAALDDALGEAFRRGEIAVGPERDARVGREARGRSEEHPSERQSLMRIS